jgi:hypothetical protein
VIDQITDALATRGRSRAQRFSSSRRCSVAWWREAGAVASIATLVTFAMVFALQPHLEPRVARAPGQGRRVDPVTAARNELIGAEDESHARLEERREQLLDERAAPY